MKKCLFVDGCIELFVNVFLLLNFICLILNKKNERICFMIKVILVLLVFDNRLG